MQCGRACQPYPLRAGEQPSDGLESDRSRQDEQAEMLREELWGRKTHQSGKVTPGSEEPTTGTGRGDLYST